MAYNQQRGSNRGRQSAPKPDLPPLPTAQTVQKFIRQDDPASMIESADIIGQWLVDQKLATSQIRSLFGTVRQIKMNWTDDNKHKESFRQAALLKPKLGYQAERLKKKTSGVKTLEKILVPALDIMIKESSKKAQKEYFDRFTDFFEAIVAYHRKYGGQN